MSQSGINFELHESFGSNKRLLIHYEFSGMSGRHIGNDVQGSTNHGVIENCAPSIDTGLHSGIVTEYQASSALAKKFTTGTFLAGDKADLSKSNIQVSGAASLPYQNLSVLVDFEFNQQVEDCVLFGSLKKTSTTINGQIITGAQGYNVGVTDRGKLFFQGFDKRGDFVVTSSSSLEMSKRNIISFALGSNQLSMSRFDYLNGQIEKDDFQIDTNFISASSNLFLGGSDQYFRGGAEGVSGEFKTSNVSLNSFALFSGYISSATLLSLGSGLIGDYFETITPATTQRRITGYSQTTVYQTGITGYDYQGTGTISVSTGRGMLTGNFFGASTVNTGEGDRFFEYRFFDLNTTTGFVAEEVGYLHPNSGYQYLPTGERAAFDTLGLQNVEGAVKEYVEQRGISGAGTVSVQLFGSRIHYGTLDKISGVLQEPIYQTVVEDPETTVSGVILGGSAENLKKDYIYYLGERI